MRTALAALLLVAGCSSGTPAARQTTPPPSSPAPSRTPAKPSAPSRTPSRTPSRPPSASPTPPPVTGTPLGIADALVARTGPGTPVTVGQNADCATVAPDLTMPQCAAVRMNGGSLLWVTGHGGDGAALVRLLVAEHGAYVVRYEGYDDAAQWQRTTVYATPLTGHGTDGLVVFVRLLDGSATYDLLTWISGGPLVLRGHRPPYVDGRLAPRSGGLDDYELATDGSYVKRRVAWDGRHFLLSAGTRVTSAPGR